MAVKIFVEGVADRKFLEDFVLHHFQRTLAKEAIIETKTWTIIISQNRSDEVIKNQMQNNTDNDGVNLLIFDADDNFSERFTAIKKWKNDNKLEFEIFLWPNNSAKGDLETVLENCINPNNQPIFDCWEKYESCLKSQSIKGRKTPLTTPARKTKIYGYLEALLGNSKSQKEKIKEKNRDYRNKDHWDLDSPYLLPLKTFLGDLF